MARIVDLTARNGAATDTEDDNTSASPTVVRDGEQLAIRELLVRGALAATKRADLPLFTHGSRRTAGRVG